MQIKRKINNKYIIAKRNDGKECLFSKCKNGFEDLTGWRDEILGIRNNLIYVVDRQKKELFYILAGRIYNDL